jgi:ABC-type transport system involved in cytochrome bd biosynthesis fused ATPase/permease subunit
MNSELKQRALTQNISWVGDETHMIDNNNISLCQIARCNKKLQNTSNNMSLWQIARCNKKLQNTSN